MLTGAPLMAIFKKYFDVMAHLDAEWPSQQNILIFIFSYFTIILVPLADTISAEPPPESL